MGIFISFLKKNKSNDIWRDTALALILDIYFFLFFSCTSKLQNKKVVLLVVLCFKMQVCRDSSRVGNISKDDKESVRARS